MSERSLQSLAILLAGLFSTERSRASSVSGIALRAAHPPPAEDAEPSEPVEH